MYISEDAFEVNKQAFIFVLKQNKEKELVTDVLSLITYESYNESENVLTLVYNNTKVRKAELTACRLVSALATYDALFAFHGVVLKLRFAKSGVVLQPLKFIGENPWLI